MFNITFLLLDGGYVTGAKDGVFSSFKPFVSF